MNFHRDCAPVISPPVLKQVVIHGITLECICAKWLAKQAAEAIDDGPDCYKVGPHDVLIDQIACPSGARAFWGRLRNWPFWRIINRQHVFEDNIRDVLKNTHAKYRARHYYHP
jgi:hypothetical protein